jgi:hypothetical protein
VPENPRILIHNPVTSPRINKTMVSRKDQMIKMANYDVTILKRDTGRANKSFMVWSEYSRPKTQPATNPNPIITAINEKTRMVIQNIFNRKALSLSVRNASYNPFIPYWVEF